MKSFIAPSYTFTPGASGVGSVNLSGISGFDVKYLVSIINQTRGEIIYSTASATLKFTNVTGTTVTLFKDTSAMNASDVLQVIYEVQSQVLPTGAATEAKQDVGNSSLSSIDTKLPAQVGGKVPVDTGLVQSLTDAQLRATPVPVSGTVTANTGLSQPLTDAQLRASSVPVSAASLPLPSGAATEAKQDVGNTSLSSIDTKTPALVSGKVPVETGLSQPLTDSELRANPVPVSVSGIATAANQTTGNSLLSSIDGKTPTLDNSKQPVIPSMTNGGNLSVTTAATGTNWTAFASQALKQLTVSNQTGTNIEFRQDGTGVGLIIPAGAIFTFFGITNANQIEARRTDTSNSQVTITARWEA